MIRCLLMDKSEKDKWLPVLFDLYYQNMSSIAPSGLSYPEERDIWLSEVSPALDKAPRQIILCLNGLDLLGYIQYYTRDSLLMIEEIQISPDYQRTLLFHRMCKYLYRILPDDIEIIEAYADVRNLYSQCIMKKLGFVPTNQVPCPELIHFRAHIQSVRSRLIPSE